MQADMAVCVSRYEDYYDLEALAAKSPLWEWVEEEGEEGEEGEWEDVEDDDNPAAMGRQQHQQPARMEEELLPVDEEDEVDEVDDDPLGTLFARCVRLQLLSDARADTLTDAIAEGSISEAALIAEWSAKL